MVRNTVMTGGLASLASTRASWPAMLATTLVAFHTDGSAICGKSCVENEWTKPTESDNKWHAHLFQVCERHSKARIGLVSQDGAAFGCSCHVAQCCKGGGHQHA